MNLTFNELVLKLNDGDLIAVRSNRGGLPKLTRFFTGSPYSHTAVVIYLDDMPWAAEMGAGGNSLVPLSRHASMPFDVFAFPGHRGLIRRNTLESLKGHIDYGAFDLLRIAAYNLLHFKLPRTDRGGMVCSAYSAWLWKGAGMRFPGMPSIPSPADLVKAVGGKPSYRMIDAG